jgi:dihydrodipicolinate synthase/N-acetylneuraminate lyase
MSRRLAPTILATCVLPWDEDYKLMEGAFREHVRLIARAITRHIYVFGTAGEGYAVTEEQFRQVAEIFHDEATRNDVTPMLGVISLSLGTIVSRIELGRSIGYRQFQLSFPRWGVVTDAELDVFFAETCGRFQDCQFLHYNTVRGGRILTGADYAVLGARHENLVAIKFTSSDVATVTELVSGADPIQCFFTEYAYAIAKKHGFEAGLLMSLSGMHQRLGKAFVAASGARLDELLDAMTEADDLLAACIDRDKVHMDGGDEKMIARAHGAEVPLRLLPPYSYGSEEGMERFAAGLAEIMGRLGL